MWKIPDNFDLSKMYQFLIRIHPFQGVFCNGQKSLVKWKDGICDADLHFSFDGTFDIELVLLCKNVFTGADIERDELFSKQDDVRKAAVSFVEAILAYLELVTLSLWGVKVEYEPPYSYPLV